MKYNKERLSVEEEIKRMSDLYNSSRYEEARRCYQQYVELLVEDLHKKDRSLALTLWDKLIEDFGTKKNTNKDERRFKK